MTDRPNLMRLTRLTERSQFLAAAGNGRRFRASAFTAQVLDRPAPDEDATDSADPAPARGLRIGLTASRHVGNAPVRNRIRRRLRVAAQQALQQVADQPLDLVLVARREVLSLPFDRLRSDIADSLVRARKPGPPRSKSPTSPSNAPNRATAPVLPARKR